MQQVVLRRKGSSLHAPDAAWADLLSEFPEGVDINAKLTRARSIPQLATYWGTLKFALENSEQLSDAYATKNSLSDALQIAVGFTRPIGLPNAPGMVFPVPRSKSFSECSQHEFNAYMDLSMRQLNEWLGWDAVETYLKRGGA